MPFARYMNICSCQLTPLHHEKCINFITNKKPFVFLKVFSFEMIFKSPKILITVKKFVWIYCMKNSFWCKCSLTNNWPFKQTVLSKSFSWKSLHIPDKIFSQTKRAQNRKPFSSFGTNVHIGLSFKFLKGALKLSEWRPCIPIVKAKSILMLSQYRSNFQGYCHPNDIPTYPDAKRELNSIIRKSKGHTFGK